MLEWQSTSPDSIVVCNPRSQSHLHSHRSLTKRLNFVAPVVCEVFVKRIEECPTLNWTEIHTKISDELSCDNRRKEPKLVERNRWRFIIFHAF
jgi:hypothetical protein